MNEWIKEMRYIHNGILFTHEKERYPTICNNMDLEYIMLSEISQTKTDSAWYHLYVELKKKKWNFWNQRVEMLPRAGEIWRI